MVLECCSDWTFWLVISGFIIAFVLAFGIGANDVANSFGTSVGSKVLTLKQACILATIFEILGSILIGAQVSGTIRKGIMNPMIFENSELELMLGYVSSLAGCCIWLIVATILNLPVSGTHSIVGAIIGMALVSRGFGSIQWGAIAKIVASWFISPLLSGLVSAIVFYLVRRFILRAKSPLNAGLKFLPLIYTITIVVNVGGILESAPSLLGLNKVPWWGNIIIEIGIAILVYLGVWLILAPYMKRKIERTLANQAALQESAKNALLHDEKQKSDEASKKSIATQVDYITLIISRNPNFQALDEDEKKREILQVKVDPDLSLQQFNISSSHPQTSYTIHSGAISGKTLKGFNRLNRIRLDSAPSGTNEDSHENVNLTLCGYLHGSYSPGFKQQLMHLKNYSSKNSVPSNQQTTQSGPQKGPGAGQFFNKIFTQPNADTNGTQTDDGNLPLLGATKELATTGQGNEGEKYGRFVRVPAKVPAVQNASQVQKDTIEEYDAEIEELAELPSKKDKKSVPEDLFAYNDPPEAAKLFSFLQVLTAIFGSFAHGGNDVSNAIGPLIGLYLIYQEGVIHTKAATPEWILFYGGVGISVGLWILGRRVIKTIGEDLTKITPSSGFVIEVASAMTVLAASIAKIPVSTTHCKVGSVVFTGRIRSKQSVDWSLFRNIIIAWIVTVPVTGTIAAGCQAALKAFFIK